MKKKNKLTLIKNSMSKTQDYFTSEKNDIVYIGDDFKEWFYDTDFSLPKKQTLYYKKLERQMLDSEILSELKPSECSLGDIAFAMKQNKELKRDWGIFYVRDKSNKLRVVYVYWFADAYGWFVSAYDVPHQSWWVAGCRVFSRNGFSLEKEFLIS